MRESTIEKVLREGVKALDGIAIKFFAISLSGFPDRIVLMPGGRIWFVELKAPGKTPSKLQEYWHRFLRKLGFDVRVYDSTASVREFLNEISQ